MKTVTSDPITSWQTDGKKVETVTDFILLGSKIMMVTAAVKFKNTCSFEEKLWQSSHCIKKQRHHFADKSPYSQSYGFSSSHVWMWELDHKEGRAPKNWCFCTMVLEKTLESPLDCKEIKPVNPNGNQPWIFI